MATVPLSGTNIRFISGVPFSNDYKHTRWFDTQTQQATYFNNKFVVHEMLKSTFQRIEGRTFVSVNKSIDKLWGTNYLFFRNLDYNNKYFYAFVTKLEYVNKEVTNVHFEIDVFQTWKFDMNFKPSFIIREHCKLWNTDGTPVVNTVDEGLNYGTDYVTVGMERVVPFKGVFFLVIVAKETMHGGTEGTKEITPTLNGLPQPLSYYIHPFTLAGTSPKVEMDGMPNIKIDSVTDVLKSLYKQEDAVNNIAALYITEYPGINAEFTEIDGFKITSEYFEHALIQDSEASFNTLYLKKQMAYIPKTIALGNKYDDYVNVTESKLLMYPYTNLILDDFKGHRITLKNEYVMNNNLNLVVRGAMGTGRQVTYHIEDYLKGKLESIPELLAISMENALVSNTPNDVPIVTDMLAAYFQGNKNAISVQTSQINANSIMDVISGGIGVLGSVGSGNGSVAGAAHEGMNMIRGTANGVLNLQAIEAKQQDIDNTPPSIQSMGSNTAFDFGNNYAGVYVIKKQIQHEYRQKLSDFFGMFGYKVNEVKLPNFHTRERWNYVQTEMCNITGNFNNDDLNELKSVFDNGITFWHTDDVGNYALENGVI